MEEYKDEEEESMQIEDEHENSSSSSPVDGETDTNSYAKQRSRTSHPGPERDTSLKQLKLFIYFGIFNHERLVAHNYSGTGCCNSGDKPDSINLKLSGYCT